MATAIQKAFPSFEQDTMEITDDPLNTDSDFDIDFEDETPAPPTYQDEHDMLDDNKPTDHIQDIELRSVTEGDDLMDDGVDMPHKFEEEEDGLMVDDVIPREEADEDLLDLSDDEDTATHAENVAITGEPPLNANDEGNGLVNATQQLAQEGLTDPSMLALPSAAGDAAFYSHTDTEQVAPAVDDLEDRLPKETGTYDAIEHDLPEALEDEGKIVTTALQDDGQVGEETSVDHPLATSKSLSDIVHPLGETQKEGHDEKIRSIPADLIEEGTMQDQTAIGSPSSRASDGPHTITGLHPTVIKYDGGEYLLFPPSEPSEGDEFFLHDENVVNQSLNDLLKACRETLGEAIDDDEELEMVVEELALYVPEDSTAAFSTSLSEILELFLSLSQLDGIEAPDPLMVSLHRRPRFANRLTLLANAAAEGRGLSSFANPENNHGHGSAPDDHEAQLEGSQHHNSDEGDDQSPHDEADSGALAAEYEEGEDAPALAVTNDDMNEINADLDEGRSRTISEGDVYKPTIDIDEIGTDHDVVPASHDAHADLTEPEQHDAAELSGQGEDGADIEQADDQVLNDEEYATDGKHTNRETDVPGGSAGDKLASPSKEVSESPASAVNSDGHTSSNPENGIAEDDIDGIEDFDFGEDNNDVGRIVDPISSKAAAASFDMLRSSNKRSADEALGEGTIDAKRPRSSQGIGPQPEV